MTRTFIAVLVVLVLVTIFSLKLVTKGSEAVILREQLKASQKAHGAVLFKYNDLKDVNKNLIKECF